jgi:DNA replication licensing factor MCM5
MSATAVRTAYIRVVGMQVDIAGTNRFGKTFTEEEEEEYIKMSKRPNLYEEFTRSIAPGVYGSSGTL